MMQTEFILPPTCVNSDPPYYKLAVFILIISNIKMFRVIISLYSEKYALKSLFKKLRSISFSNPSASFSPGSDISTEEELLKKEDSNNTHSFLLKFEKKSFAFFKKELLRILKFSRNEEQNGNKSEQYSNLCNFNSRIKDIIYKRLFTIKSTVFISIAAVSYAVLMEINTLADLGISDWKSNSGFRNFTFSSLICIDPYINFLGLLLAINLLLCFMAYVSVKRKYYFILENTDQLFDRMEQ